MGFKASKLNPGMFYHPSTKMDLAVHVDDLFIIGRKEVLQWLKAELEKVYMVTGEFFGPEDKRKVSYLGRTIEWKEDGIHWTHGQKYVTRLLKEWGMESQ